MSKYRYYFFGIIIILITWTGFSLYFSHSIIPFPWSVTKHFFSLVSTTDILAHLGLTFLRTISGFFLALFFGFGLGLLTAMRPNSEKMLHFPLVLLQGCPPLLWIVPLLLILGPGGIGPVVIVYLVVLPVIIINIREARKQIPEKYFDVVKIYADKHIDRIKYILIPQLSGAIKSVILIGIVLAYKSSLLGEWFGAENGIGRKIYEYFYTYDMLSFYAVSFLYLLFLGLNVAAVNLILKFFLNRKSSRITQNQNYLKYLSRSKEFTGLKNKSEIKKIELYNIDFAYPNKPLLFSQLTWDIDCSQPIIITGPSGTGKTTLAKLLAGLLKPKAGSIYLSAEPYLIFQEDVFFNHHDCLENINLAVKRNSKSERQQFAINVLNQCGLGDCFDLFPDELSGGMKKRLAFARAMAADPEFIILDEPFINLDKKSRQELWALFFQLFPQRKIPSLIITHYPEELNWPTEKACLYRLYNGKISKVPEKLKFQTIILN